MDDTIVHNVSKTDAKEKTVRLARFMCRNARITTRTAGLRINSEPFSTTGYEWLSTVSDAGVRMGVERVLVVVATDGGPTCATGAHKTFGVDSNASCLPEDDVQLVSIGTEKEVTRRSETETMSGRCPDLTWFLPRILRFSRAEIVGPSTFHPNTDLQPW